ncbi:MAG: tRNA (N(6)-L-threonylcarbamoyladenosine(37)-C(2))-methylthiotransferase MtaB [Verrucomicrobia bacterium]|nr:tRNA (N(6)-L-threonylcarbamoyladenosine(37)-C(2))-methylthiotransferase MtaB [Verrucomicrobiota bacterium]
MKHSLTFSIYTLGCKLNFSESSSIAGVFEDRGYARVDFKDGADIVLINACSVTEQADKKCRQIVSQAKNLSPDAFIAIIGCYAQLQTEEIGRIQGVDLVVGASDKFKIADHVAHKMEQKEAPSLIPAAIKNVKTFSPAYSMGDRSRTFLKIQDGCDYFCSFCTIPLARGRSRSNSIVETMEQVHEIAQKEIREIVLTGVNTGDFGRLNGESFLELIQEMDQAKGIDRFRISSIEPNLLSDEIIEFVAQSKKFVPHFHIPLQSGSDEVLKAMRRRYRSALYKERVEKIKRLMPDACIGVDVICGYPNETDERYEETYRFLADLDVSYLHVFTYSERPNTPAARRNDHISKNVRRLRSKQLQLLSDKKKRHFYESQLQKKLTVLFENQEQNGEMFGYTENYIRVKSTYNPQWVNQLKHIVPLSINTDGTVFAEILVDEYAPLEA